MSTRFDLPLFERRFKAIFEQTSVPTQLYSAEGHIKATNGAWHQWTGVTPEALESVIAGGYCLYQDEQLISSGVVDNFKTALGGTSVQTQPRFYDLSKSGPHTGAVWLQSNFYPIPDDTGEIVEVLILHHDVTELMTAKKNVESALAEAQAALDVRDEFLSIASHELKTPVTGLQLGVQLLRRLLESDKVKEAQMLSGDCEKYTFRLATLVNELLDLTRIRAGKIDLQLTTCDLSELTGECIRGFPIKSVTLEATHPVFLQCDRNRIDQILTNLITNAIKFGEDKPITVKIEKTHDQICLSVRDQGRGIALKEQQQIFERFGRASNSRGVGGLGLGLYITRQLVEAHGGVISVESTPGQGATFLVKFRKS